MKQILKEWLGLRSLTNVRLVCKRIFLRLMHARGKTIKVYLLWGKPNLDEPPTAIGWALTENVKALYYYSNKLELKEKRIQRKYYSPAGIIALRTMLHEFTYTPRYETGLHKR